MLRSAAAAENALGDVLIFAGRSYPQKGSEELANLAEPIGIADVVASAGVGLSALYQGFRARHGLGPMAWLRQRRIGAGPRRARHGRPQQDDRQ
jgi:hypothetical protein